MFPCDIFLYQVDDAHFRSLNLPSKNPLSAIVSIDKDVSLNTINSPHWRLKRHTFKPGAVFLIIFLFLCLLTITGSGYGLMLLSFESFCWTFHIASLNSEQILVNKFDWQHLSYETV